MPKKHGTCDRWFTHPWYKAININVLLANMPVLSMAVVSRYDPSGLNSVPVTVSP